MQPLVYKITVIQLPLSHFTTTYRGNPPTYFPSRGGLCVTFVTFYQRQLMSNFISVSICGLLMGRRGCGFAKTRVNVMQYIFEFAQLLSDVIDLDKGQQGTLRKRNYFITLT